jgi:tetratricopeptide (TPR) repeat protein
MSQPRIVASFLVVLVSACAPPAAQSVAKGQMLYDNGLMAEAQRELIDVLFSSAVAADKAKALDLLATVAVDRGNYKAALDAWTRLTKDYPQSPEAKRATERLPLLANVIGQLTQETVTDAAARIYLRSADFWSKDRDHIFTIDASWIDTVDAAVFWYDKTISAFAGTSAARVAYEEKMRTLLGWKEPGQYGQTIGAKGDPAYLPKLEVTFREYEKTFPDAGAAQGFRFMIAQAYWMKKNWAKTREWLNEVIAKDKGTGSFYKDLAERRLKHVEY